MARSSRSGAEPIVVYGISDKGVVSEIDLIPPEIMPQTDAGIELVAQFEKAHHHVDGVIFSQGKTQLGNDLS
jgi:hypothetical protein